MASNTTSQQITPVQTISQEPVANSPILNQKGFVPIILGVIVLLIIVAGGAYYLGTRKNQNNPSTLIQVNQTSPTPTTIPQVTSSPITNGTKQQGNWTIKYIQKSQTDFIQDVHLINNATNEDRIIGQTYVIAPGEHAVFTKDLLMVILLGARNEGDKLTSESVTFYSIPQSKVIKTISLGDIKTALPSLSIPRNAALNSLVPSPLGNKIAMSYGYTYELDSGSDIIIIDVSTYKISTVDAKGVVKLWKDNNTLQYQVTQSTGNGESINTVTKEIGI